MLWACLQIKYALLKNVSAFKSILKLANYFAKLMCLFHSRTIHQGGQTFFLPVQSKITKIVIIIISFYPSLIITSIWYLPESDYINIMPFQKSLCYSSGALVCSCIDVSLSYIPLKSALLSSPFTV